jgi:hypothetical protein
MASGGPKIIRRKIETVVSRSRAFDTETADRFRTYRGKYPREGYDVETTNPFAKPKDIRVPPPIRD